MAVDGGRHPAPDDRIGKAGPAQDLRHLGDVAEHVGQVTDLHRSAEIVCPPPAALEVAHQRFAADQELVHQDLPRADGQASALDVTPQALLLLRPNLEVVVDRGQLTVQREGKVRLCLEHLHHAIHEVHELHPEALERPIPLAVPVRVRDEVNGRLAVRHLHAKPTAFRWPSAYDE